MSASHDKTQKVTFVYSNLYELYRRGKDAAVASPDPAPVLSEPIGFQSSGNVLKAQDLRTGAATAKVEAYAPAEFIGKRVAKPDFLPPRDTAAIDSLKKNLEQLNDLHSRLRFMLQELEDLVKE
ncbi:MAG: hypothetical protein A2X94_15770 [Bdellovibrionales bacterium GWB1_55_8]|nr:MAG: hypothetical protein A2X94_15770 [Bdellovibrionales bacterium GWB1_55_8]